MTLRYRWSNLIVNAIVFLCALWVIYASQTGYELRILVFPVGSNALLVAGVLAALASLYGLRHLFRPHPIHIDEPGLTLRMSGINQTVPWTALDAVILEPHADGRSVTARLLLVPAVGVDLGKKADHPSPIDGRPSIALLSLNEIREPKDHVAKTLARYAGPRFVDGTGSMTPQP
jgi:hypothetical protein